MIKLKKNNGIKLKKIIFERLKQNSLMIKIRSTYFFTSRKLVNDKHINVCMTILLYSQIAS